MKFKNIKTNQLFEVTSPTTIEIFKKDKAYEEVKETKEIKKEK